MKKIDENKYILHNASDKHLRTYLNLHKPKSPAETKIYQAAQKEYAFRKLKNTLTSKNIAEEGPTNAMGASSSSQGPIQTFDPLMGRKKVLKRFKDVTNAKKSPVNQE